MIEHIYKCDLCRSELDTQPGSHDRAGHRIKFVTDVAGNGGIRFTRLTDDQASETIICNECIRGIVSAAAKL